MAEQSRAAIIPVYNEHDPRNPPVGRTLEAEVRKRRDGEYELLSTYELFAGSIGADGDFTNPYEMTIAVQNQRVLIVVWLPFTV